MSGALILGAGLSVDASRLVLLHTSLQDTADAAALAGAAQNNSTDAVNAAKAYVAAAAAQMSGTPTVGGSYNYDNTTDSTTPTMSVSLSSSLPTTLMALFTKTMNSAAAAKASGTLARNVVMTLSNFNSSASDLDQVYWYTIPSNLSGSSLYSWTPSLSSSNIILSNDPNSKLASSVTFQVGFSDVVGFAMSNQTGGVNGYSVNCYGQTKGATANYYSHRLDSNSDYHDYPSIAFKGCGYTLNYGGTLYACPQAFISYCSNNGAFAAGNYIYDVSYSRNPLQITSANRDCTQGTVSYAWDDNGGGSDDNDFNDAVFSVSCTTTNINKATVRLIS